LISNIHVHNTYNRKITAAFFNFPVHKKSLKIPKGQSEAVNGRRKDTTMVRRRKDTTMARRRKDTCTGKLKKAAVIFLLYSTVL
jgi:hypothetical protein